MRNFKTIPSLMIFSRACLGFAAISKALWKVRNIPTEIDRITAIRSSSTLPFSNNIPTTTPVSFMRMGRNSAALVYNTTSYKKNIRKWDNTSNMVDSSWKLNRRKHYELVNHGEQTEGALNEYQTIIHSEMCQLSRQLTVSTSVLSGYYISYHYIELSWKRLKV